MDADEVKAYLKSLKINFSEHKHPPVYTVEESDKNYGNIKGMHCKSLFIKNRKSRNYYLVMLEGHKRLNLESLGERLGEKLKFANEKELDEILGVKPGSVSPFTLINDKESKVNAIIDKEVWDAEIVAFHPNINTETLDITGKDFQKYINSLKNKVSILELS
jgi:Ala-tRNA(Pro) deacylase